MKDEAADTPITYHLDHAARFQYTLERVQDVIKPGGTIADVGCHRLDFAKLLRDAGYEVIGFDVPEFIDKATVRKRAEELGIRLVRIEDLGRGRFEDGLSGIQCDGIVFAEIVEHITFNPLEMWRVLFSLLRPNGWLFVTTPNSLSLQGTYRGLKRILSRRGQGISVGEIFSTVTYGHHWKEYSRGELIEYFSLLGIPERNIEVDYVQYTKRGAASARSFRSLVKTVLMSFDPLKPDLFCAVRLESERPRLPASPQYLG